MSEAPTMAEALNRALRDSLASDERTLVFGEDVGRLGGIFRVTDGLQDEFGPERVFDTPIAEAGIVGASIGLVLAGFRPVAEMQFDAWSYPAFEQIVSHLAKYRNRTRGRTPMPVVVRIPAGGGLRGKEHHGESPETLYVHTPGLKVATPSDPPEANRLLTEAIADPDPVIFLEPKVLYRSTKAFAPLGEPAAGRARTLRDGDDCLIVAYGGTVAPALEAAESLEAEGIGCAVVDLRWLSPLDTGTIVGVVRRTRRAVVVHEAPRTLGLGAEIAARIMEEAFDHLDAPVARVTGYDTPYPPASLEELWLPTAERIAEAVRGTLAYR